MMRWMLVSGNWKVWGFLFAYHDSVVVSMQVWYAKGHQFNYPKGPTMKMVADINLIPDCYQK